MPHVHDEDEAVTVGVLPDLVLEGVVEDEDFTLLPLPATAHEEEREVSGVHARHRSALFTADNLEKTQVRQEMRRGDEERK